MSDMGLIKNLNKSKNNFIFSQAHDSHYRTAYNMFKDKPFFGHGPKMFRIICSEQSYTVGKYPCSTHPHNFYIQLLAETGILGFLFLLSVLIYIFHISFRQLKSILFKQNRPLTDYQVCLLSAILVSFWPLSPNGNFFNNWLMITYSLSFGFYLQSIFSKKNC
tara:strand:+ start:62 stop:550 length:489 start_codon:yes stop_codon:yes gene_type:complete